jgi:hypothetical protein
LSDRRADVKDGDQDENALNHNFASWPRGGVPIVD